MDSVTVTSVNPNLTESLANVTDTWNSENTRLLIKLYQDNHQRIGLCPGMKTKRSMWRLIRDELDNHGHHFTSVQVENRWKTLLRGYKKTLGNINSNRSRHSNEFQKELSELDADNNFLVPEITLESFSTFRKLPGFASSTPESEQFKIENIKTEIQYQNENDNMSIVDEGIPKNVEINLEQISDVNIPIINNEMDRNVIAVDPEQVADEYSPGRLSPISCYTDSHSKLSSLRQEYIKVKINCLIENMALRKEKLIEYTRRTRAIEKRNEIFENLLSVKRNINNNFNNVKDLGA